MRPLIKRVCYAVALAIVSPFVLAECLARRLRGHDVWFATHAEALSLLPGTAGHFLRNAYYARTLYRCPWNCCFQFGTIFTHSAAEVGQRVYTGTRCVIGTATIGDYTMLADCVQVLSGGRQHGIADAKRPFQDQPQSFTRVHIGSNCWIGSGAIVMADVDDNCVVGAGSVVTKAIAAGSVAVGNPARVIRRTLQENTSTPSLKEAL